MICFRAIAALLLATFASAQSDQEMLRRARHFEQEKDGKSAILILIPLVRRRIPAAQYLLGSIYVEGEHVYPGVPKNPALGWNLIKKAAENDDQDAQYYLANEYAFGPGGVDDPIPQDRAQGVLWFRKAAAKGSVHAMCMLGNCLREGWGTKIDFKEAMVWFRKAARKGDCVAMARLGGMYRDGQGVPQDFTEAHAWLNLAATGSQDHPNLGYEKERDSLAERMGPDQVGRAQARARKLMAELGLR